MRDQRWQRSGTGSSQLGIGAQLAHAGLEVAAQLAQRLAEQVARGHAEQRRPRSR